MKNTKKCIGLLALIITIAILIIIAVTVGQEENKELEEVNMISFLFNNITYTVPYGTDWYTWTNQNYHAKYTSYDSEYLEGKNEDGSVSTFKIDNYTTGEQSVRGNWLIQEGCVYALIGVQK